MSEEITQEELNIIYTMMIQLESAMKELEENMDELRKQLKEMI